MGELEKEKGAWGYVEGGMGGVSQSIACSARSLGADIFTNKVSIQEVGVTIFSSHCFCAWHTHSFKRTGCLTDINLLPSLGPVGC